MFEKHRFLEKYSLTSEKLQQYGISWQNLIEIYDHYQEIRASLLPTAKYIAEELENVPQVHTVRYRLKETDHLIEKIIRKKKLNPSLQINKSNYQEIITDLIGVRAIHLFKQDWVAIHKFILSSWDLKSSPEAYVRCTTPENLLEDYRKNQCEILTHPFGYQSIHYLILLQNHKADRIVEIQVRTILEEAWSEIDHQIRYPYENVNPLLSEYLKIFNGLIEQLDQMGSLISSLKKAGFDEKIISELKTHEGNGKGLLNRLFPMFLDNHHKKQGEKM